MSSPSASPPAAPAASEIDVHRQPGWLDGRKSDRELRAHQLRLLRRRWLKDQELSPREPVLPPAKLGPVARFWARFLEPNTFWRRQDCVVSLNSVYGQVEKVLAFLPRVMCSVYMMYNSGLTFVEAQFPLNISKSFLTVKAIRQWNKLLPEVYGAYTNTVMYVGLIVPLWLAHYYVKYHLMEKQHGIIITENVVYPGDIIDETNEVIPPLKIPKSHH